MTPLRRPSAEPNAMPVGTPTVRDTVTLRAIAASRSARRVERGLSARVTSVGTSSHTLSPSMSPSAAPNARPTTMPKEELTSTPTVTPAPSPVSRPIAMCLRKARRLARVSKWTSLGVVRGEIMKNPAASPTARAAATPSAMPCHRPPEGTTASPVVMPVSTASSRPAVRASRRAAGTLSRVPIVMATMRPSGRDDSHSSTRPASQASRVRGSRAGGDPRDGHKHREGEADGGAEGYRHGQPAEYSARGFEDDPRYGVLQLPPGQLSAARLAETGREERQPLHHVRRLPARGRAAATRRHVRIHRWNEFVEQVLGDAARVGEVRAEEFGGLPRVVAVDHPGQRDHQRRAENLRERGQRVGLQVVSDRRPSVSPARGGGPRQVTGDGRAVQRQQLYDGGECHDVVAFDRIPEFFLAAGEHQLLAEV